MSKNLKQKSKPFIPKSARGATFNSLEAMGVALGFKPVPAPEPFKKTCNVCGTPMRLIPETNVWVCDGTKEDGKPCSRRILSNPRPADKLDDKSKPEAKSDDKPKDNRQDKPKQKKPKYQGKPSGKPAQAQATA